MLVLFVFYILLCAFILANPQFALFFNNVFGIEYITIRFVLEYTIYVFYSIFAIILGLIFLFFWYRSIVIKTHKKYKRASLWWLTVLFWGLFFGNIALFALTYNWFLGIDFTNLSERVLLYDNNLLWYKSRFFADEEKEFFRVPKKVIGPVNVRYDISPQIKKIVRENGLLLNRGYSFKIDYNKDGDPDIGSGDNVRVDVPILEWDPPTMNPDAPLLIPGIYNEVGEYITTATLIGIDAWGNRKEIDVEMPDILVQNIVGITRKEGKDGAKIYIFDASSLKNLWQARWSILGSDQEEYIGDQFSPQNITTYPAVVCLKMQPAEPSASDPCDWRYVIGENMQTNITNTTIQVKVDPINPLKYQFILDPKLWQGQIRAIRWKIDGRLYDGKFPSGTEKILDYTFIKSGTYLIEAEIEDTLGSIVNTSTDPIFTVLFTNLKSRYMLDIVDEGGVNISDNTYDEASRLYLLSDIPVPTVITLDAIGVQSVDPRLKLDTVEWDLDNDDVYEKTGFKISHALMLPQQYTIRARYVFRDKTIDGDEQRYIYIDKIIIKWIEKAIDVRVKVRPDHDYAPALVQFDATMSRVQTGDIRKFIYDFWNGKIFEGEWLEKYRYNEPGEYKVRVTAVKDTGEKDTKELTLIIKKPSETVRIEPSISSENALAGLPITFDARVLGWFRTVTWDFGDNTGLIEGTSIIHTFRTPWKYTISVWVVYESGIEKTETILYQVR